MSNDQIGVLWVVGSCVAYGIVPVWIVITQNGGFSTEVILFIRFFISACLLYCWAIYKHQSIKIPKKKLFHFFLLGGFIYTIQSAAYFESLRFIPASLSVLLYHIYPIIVTLVAVIHYKEKFTSILFFSIFISLVGLLFVLQIPKDMELHYYGVFLAIFGAFFYAIYVIFSKTIAQNISSTLSSFYICIFAALILFLASYAKGSFIPKQITLLGVFGIIGLTLLSTLFAMVAYFVGMRKIGITKTSILGMIEPLVAIMLSLLILGEHLSLFQYIGASLILFGSFLLFIKK